MNDNEKKIICTATHVKKFHYLVTYSFLDEKEALVFVCLLYGYFQLIPKNKESQDLGVSWSQGDGLATNSNQSTV